MTSTSGVNYNTFISNLEAKGIQTTALYSDAETNFQQYGEALSSDLKQEILQSFDTEQDYILQQQIAELFKSTNVVDSSSFISQCQSLGLNCSVEYVSTSYIVDYKQSQSGAVVDGAIAVYTISDGKGGEIKIADANGNGSLESEELFMNEILGDINNEISGTNTNSGAIQGIDGDEKKTISQEEFNQKVEEYLTLGFTKEEATKLSNEFYGATNGVYTGAYTSASQDEFNNLVDKYLKAGKSKETSVLKVKNQLRAQGALNVDSLYYTGKKDSSEEENVEIADTDEDSETNKTKPSISLVMDKKEKEAA